jgi:hypothetical protein
MGLEAYAMNADISITRTSQGQKTFDQARWPSRAKSPLRQPPRKPRDKLHL